MLYRSTDYNFDRVRSAGVLSAGRTKRARNYVDCVSAFDIETSRVTVNGEEHAIMYIWQWAIEDDVIIGRTWDEYLAFVDRLLSVLYELNAYLIVFIHNAAYEFSFLKGIHNFGPDEVFCVDKRRPLKFDWDSIEFRCSFLHSGLSLKAWLNEVKAPHRKLSGKAFNYDVIRYPWTPLTYREMQYCINDVRGIVDAIHIEMARDNDTLQTIPLTKTGYVRRIMKKAIHDNVSYNIMKQIQPDYDLYIALREAFRGGDTHASRFYSGKILKDVKHVDRSSSYPDVMCNYMFPMSKFMRIDNPSVDDVVSCIKHNKAVLMRLRLLDVELKSLWRYGCPYIPVDRCRYLASDVVEDNGRVLSASYLEITLTDVDFEIVFNQYNAQIEVRDMWSCRYGLLPQPVRDVIIELYHKKTSLKGVQGQELIYALSKSMINSCYGMTAQDPGKPGILYKKSDDRQFVYDVEQDRRKLINDNAKKNFLPYQIGVWVTALARRELHAAIDMIDNCERVNNKPVASFVYCDTDSVFYLGDIDWTKYNVVREKQSINSGAWATDRKGKPHYMGVMEFEDPCKRFACLGAKKYVCEDEHGTLHITIAGVAKDLGGVELTKLGGLERFVDMQDPPLFVAAGGTEIKYNDNVSFYASIQGHRVHITDNAVIRPSTYQLGVTTTYYNLLQKVTENIDLIDYMGDLC